jgi:hypothetical protein
MPVLTLRQPVDDASERRPIPQDRHGTRLKRQVIDKLNDALPGRISWSW